MNAYSLQNQKNVCELQVGDTESILLFTTYTQLILLQ